METKILGIDLGTNSIGLSVRDKSRGGNVANQLEYFTSVIFESGVGTDKTGEFSRAAVRTAHRGSRRLNQSRRYRIWRTLQVLINFGYCPLTDEELKKWSHYDKNSAVKREYPIKNERFEQWVRLDFNLDGIPDYTSPYQLRAELATRKLDLTQELDRFKLGRALYHIAQRRGFKSSKGETLNDIESDAKDKDVQEVEMTDALKKSEQQKSSKLIEYIDQHNLKTAGQAFAQMERDGIRVRGNGDYQAVRDLYEREVRTIFETQGINPDEGFGLAILSRKKGEGSLFYKRPLRSQKGTVGRCTLEPTKTRCPMSRPEFEEFRAWSLINNIRYSYEEHGEQMPLTIEMKHLLFNNVFTRAARTFKFADIEKNLLKQFSSTGKAIYLNYRNNTTVSGCPVINKLKQLLGDDWKTATIPGHSSRDEKGVKQYGYEDLWHVCFEADDAEDVTEFCQKHLSVDVEVKMIKLWGAMSDGYANLSLKAINNINRLLFDGYIYSDSVLWAKVADIVGVDSWYEHKVTMLDAFDVLKERVQHDSLCTKIANNTITNYRMLPDEQKFAIGDTSYIIDDDDRKDIRKFAKEMFSPKAWKEMSDDSKNDLLECSAELYQTFFADPERKMLPVPKLTNAIADFISTHFADCIKPEYKNKNIAEILYHPSAIDIYPKAKRRDVQHNGTLLSLRLLDSPATNVFRNPMVMRVLHQLRHQINDLLLDGIIDEDTRIVVETAREFNDANVRWSIEQYQKIKSAENEEIRKRLIEINPTMDIKDSDIAKVKLLLDQAFLDEDCQNLKALRTTEKKRKFSEAKFSVDMEKYKLWLEQKCRSIYTGKVIPLSKLFDNVSYDIEHTIPRSVCFDDSLTNKTICEASYNRETKKNRMPSQLDNFEEIKQRIQPWIKRRDDIRELVNFWKGESKKSSTVDRKNDCIRQRHLWEMELEYWTKKVENFIKDPDRVTDGFRNSQLVDTRIITKYAMHYLKSVFRRVDVQRGDMTASFRKAFGIQELYERKSRDRHSHHAIDATMLTLIPTNQQRDRILELFYLIEEAQALGKNCDTQRNELEALKQRNDINNVSEVNRFIEENILIRHTAKDQTLKPARKKIRVRGKVRHFEKGVVRYQTGDCIRGQLHKETYFGAIKYPKVDEDGEPMKRDGMYVYEQDENGNEPIMMVVRVPIDSFKKKEEFDKIIDPKVRESVKQVVAERISEGKTFAVALSEPIYLLDQVGNEIREDRKGRKLLPIRHVRCRVAAGRGFMTTDKALTIRTQTYKSVHDYKNSVYAQNDGNYLCLLYEGEKKGKLVRKMSFVNYFEVAQMHLRDSNELFQNPNYASFTDKNVTYKLKYIIKSGCNVLMYENSIDELRDMEQKDLYKRLFVVYKFNKTSSEHIYLQNVIEARSNEKIVSDQLKIDGMTNYDSSMFQHRINLVADSCNFAVQGIDFEITTKGIIFK